MKRAHGPDINYWTEPYKDDNIDEGTQMDFVIIKAADGKYDYLDSDNFKARYDSIKHVKVKGFFQYYRTKYSPEDNAATIIKVINSGLFEFGSLDFEGTNNVITSATIKQMKRCWELVHKATGWALLLYSNGSILKQIRYYEKDWNPPVWFAGGVYYNSKAVSQLPDHIPFPQKYGYLIMFWQYSADGNQFADEMDFGEREVGAIDLDVFNGTIEELYEWAGVEFDHGPEETVWNQAIDAGIAALKILKR